MPALAPLPPSAPLVSEEESARLRALVAAAEPSYLEDLRRLVGIDCGSYTPAGVNEVGRWVAAALAGLGAEVTSHPSARLGETVVGVLRGDGRMRVLLIGHLDTVFDPGTAAARPFRVDGGRAYGPGVSDMKGGLLAGLYALSALRGLAGVGPEEGVDPTAWLPFAELVFIANPDEEIGSPESTPVIRQAARGTDVALVLEGARANGDIVSTRKGTVDLRLTLTGRAAHAGVEPERGRSALLEAAHKTVALHALNGRWPGVTCNVGVVHGGTRPNVVAATAVLEVDLRAASRAELEAAEAEVRAIAAAMTVPEVTCDVAETGRHWPMEKLPASGRLVGHAVGLAGRLGFSLHDCATGGASDANTTAGMGVPSLDGLGPIGGLDHAPGEYLELASIGPRVTLLAALLLAVARDVALRRGDMAPTASE